jgi:hypothetical protein
MLRAVRDEPRKGADHVKLTVSGGVVSPSRPRCARRVTRYVSASFRFQKVEKGGLKFIVVR